MTARVIILFGASDPDAAGSAARGVPVAKASDVDAAVALGRMSDSVSLVGVGAAGSDAIAASALLGEAVDRLALVAVPVPDDAPMLDDLRRVTAKILVMAGQKDPAAASGDATRLKKAQPALRVEMVPRSERLELAHVWPRILRHVAPR